MKDGFFSKYGRPLICLVIVAVFFTGFAVRLFDWQIIQGKYYRDEVSSTSNYELTSAATRGEIVDLNGVAVESNTTVYNVVVNKLYIGRNMTVNKIITQLFDLLNERKVKWTDTLPIVTEGDSDYEFAQDSEKELEILRSGEMLDIGVYSTAQEYMDLLVERYDAQDIKDRQLCRDVVSVRYNMERKGFNNTTPYTFAEDIGEDAVAIVSEFSQAQPCIEVVAANRRVCNDGTLMPHILGITGALTAEEYEQNADKGYSYDDIIGKFGIELAMESYLKGAPGTKTVAKDADGTVVNVVNVKEAQPGNTVYLTVDSRIQKVANESLAKNVAAARASGVSDCAEYGDDGYGEDCTAGAAVMLSVRDFSVLAAATYPTYDITKYNKTDYYNSLLEDDTLPLYNRAISGSFAPGSVVKPAVALAALEEGTISEYSTVNCTKYYDYYPTNVVQCMGTHGDLSVVGAITKSCNYYFADVGRRLGIDSMYLYFEKLGLGEKTGLEISESKGILAGRDSTSWVAGNTVQAAIGQSDNTFTPIQLATYAATIATGGTRYRTHLVSKVTSYDRSETVFENDPGKPETVSTLGVGSYSMRLVQYAMRQVVDDPSGTAHSVFGSYDIPIAAKTGTAENSGSDHTVFICYAPYDKPEVAVAVLLEHGAKGMYSMSVAKDMLNEYFHPGEQASSTAAG